MRDENPTVYSTEWGRVCPQCGRPVKGCICRKKTGQSKMPADGVVRVSRESKGRKGKTVTLVHGVPGDENAQRKIMADLKRRCGAGGAIKEGVIEIQGDQREKVIEALKKLGFNVKQAGG